MRHGRRASDVLYYHAHGHPSFGATLLTEREERRYELERVENDRAAAMSDLLDGSWFVVGCSYNGVLPPPKFIGRKLKYGLATADVIVLNGFHKVRTGYAKGGEIMARSISVNEILKQAEAAQAAYTAAVEQRKNVRKVAKTLAEAGLLDEEDVAKVEEIFPARKSKDEAEDAAE